MSNVLGLTSQNFSVAPGRNGKILKISIPGNTLLFIKTNNCPGCQELEPVFISLASTDRRVNYAIINVDDYRDVVISARDTTTPIQSVPMLLLYCNQYPKAKFTGAKNVPSLQSFLTKALQPTPSTGPVSQTAAMNALSNHQFMPTSAPQTQMNAGTTLPPQMGPGMSGYAMTPGVAPNRAYQPDFAAGSGGQVAPRGRQNTAMLQSQSSHPLGGGHYGGSQMAGVVEDDDDASLITPGTVIPHNTPWEISKKM